MRQALFVLLLFSMTLSAQEKVEVFFDFNKDMPNAASAVNLQHWMEKNKTVLVTAITGYCDSVDNNHYNRNLASRRIQSILETLKKNGFLIADKIELNPVGEDVITSNNAGQNRRVDIFFKIPKAVVPVAQTSNAIIPVEENRPAEIGDLSDTIPIKDKLRNVKKGDIISIRNINFYFNSEKVMPDSEPRIAELHQVMLDNPKLRIEIHGHICCNPNTADTKLSYRRAKYIFTYLLKHGIPLDRLGYRGYGSAQPIYKIPEKSLMEMAANRRVEILIIDI
jgi:outer membrane protein OmpA-like peptidoglycan-associated protein